MNCPYLFEHQGKRLCVLGMDCASKTEDQRITCRDTASFFHKDMTPNEIETLKKKIIQDSRKNHSSLKTYQVKVKPITTKTADQQKKELQEKIKGYRFNP